MAGTTVMYTQTGESPFCPYEQEEPPRDVLQQELTLLRVEVRAIHRMLERERREHATTRSQRIKLRVGWARGSTLVALGLLYTALVALIVTLVATSPAEPLGPMRNAVSAVLVASPDGASVSCTLAPESVAIAPPVVVVATHPVPTSSSTFDPFATPPGSRD